MHLSDHSLSQLDEAYVLSLDEGRLRGLSLRLLEDLKEARERLRQNPTNRSRPPSSRAPWERPSAGDEQAPDEAEDDASTSPEDDPPGTPDADAAERDSTGTKPPKPKRKPGKQPGAPGFGRTQVLQARETRHHHPGVCEACAEALPGDAPSVAYAGFQSVDLVWGNPEQPGMHLQVTDHRLYETTCACTRAHAPAKGWSRIRPWNR